MSVVHYCCNAMESGCSCTCHFNHVESSALDDVQSDQKLIARLKELREKAIQPRAGYVRWIDGHEYKPVNWFHLEGLSEVDTEYIVELHNNFERLTELAEKGLEKDDRLHECARLIHGIGNNLINSSNRIRAGEEMIKFVNANFTYDDDSDRYSMIDPDEARK